MKDKWLPVTADNMANTAQHIAENADLLRGIAEAIREAKFDTVQVRKWLMMCESMEGIDTFLAAAREGLMKARQDRGDIPKKPEVAKKKPKPKPKGARNGAA